MPTSQYRQLLTRFDLPGLDRYGITADDLQHIERYIHILQSGLNETVWDEAVQRCDMIRVRKLQRKGEDGTWHSDAYAVEMPNGQITLRYSLAWEYLGGRYHRMIRERELSLEQLEQVLDGNSLRWLPVEKLETDYEKAIQALDHECHVPRPASVLSSRRTQPEQLTLEARIVDGRLRLNAPLTSPIRVQGDLIYLEDGRQLQIALASDLMPESQPG